MTPMVQKNLSTDYADCTDCSKRANPRNPRSPRIVNARLFVLLVVVGLPAVAADWPQWRGPKRDGVIASYQAPAKWPEQPTLKWRVAVGEGHSSPLLAGGRVYQLARLDEQEVVYCLDAASGKVLWKQAYDAPYTMNPAARGHGKGPKSTPVLADGKLYTFGISGILSSFDAATGQLRWRKDFSAEFQATSPHFGTAMSPVVDGGLLIAHAGGHDSGALIAFDAASGREKWRWNADGPAYASPVIAEVGGTRQVITFSQQRFVGISAANGQLLWSMPYTTPYVQNIVTPVVTGDTVIFSGLNNGTSAIRPVKGASGWEIEKLWHTDEVSMYMSSPVLVDGRLFGLSHRRKGQFFGLDARSGKLLWATNGREGDNAAMVAAGGLLFALTSESELVIARNAADAFQQVRRYTVADSPTWAHPVIDGGHVLVKDANTLALWSLE